MKLFLWWCPALVLGCAVLCNKPIQAAAPVAPDSKHVHALVKQLDDKQFAVRKRADKKLRQLGKPAFRLLLKELKAAKSLEVRRRLEKIIGPLLSNQKILLAVRQLGKATFVERQHAAEMTLQACQEWLKYGKNPVPLLRKIQFGEADIEVRARLEVVISKLK